MTKGNHILVSLNGGMLYGYLRGFKLIDNNPYEKNSGKKKKFVYITNARTYMSDGKIRQYDNLYIRVYEILYLWKVNLKNPDKETFQKLMRKIHENTRRHLSRRESGRILAKMQTRLRPMGKKSHPGL